MKKYLFLLSILFTTGVLFADGEGFHPEMNSVSEVDESLQDLTLFSISMQNFCNDINKRDMDLISYLDTKIKSNVANIELLIITKTSVINLVKSGLKEKTDLSIESCQSMDY